MKIKDMPVIDRPREKMSRHGPNGLTTIELFAVLLGSGRKGENVMQLAKRVAKIVETESAINTSIKSFTHIDGLGVAKISALIACIELGKRLLQQKKSILLMNPKDVWEELYDIRQQKKEHFIIFYLDIRNQIIKKNVISIGTLTASIVHPREVFEPAIRDGAAQIILSHNHPSGIVEPSEADIELTKRLVQAGSILGIEIIDHIIVAKTAYFSFRQQKMV